MSHKDDELEEAGMHEVGAEIEGDEDELPKKAESEEDAEVLKVMAAIKDEEDVVDAPLEDDDEDAMPPLDMGLDADQYRD